MSIISLEHVRRLKIVIYMHDLLQEISNHTKFQLNWLRTDNYHLKLLNTAVTLKYNQGH